MPERGHNGSVRMLCHWKPLGNISSMPRNALSAAGSMESNCLDEDGVLLKKRQLALLSQRMLFQMPIEEALTAGPWVI